MVLFPVAAFFGPLGIAPIAFLVVGDELERSDGAAGVPGGGRLGVPGFVHPHLEAGWGPVDAFAGADAIASPGTRPSLAQVQFAPSVDHFSPCVTLVGDNVVGLAVFDFFDVDVGPQAEDVAVGGRNGTGQVVRQDHRALRSPGLQEGALDVGRSWDSCGSPLFLGLGKGPRAEGPPLSLHLRPVVPSSSGLQVVGVAQGVSD